MRLSGRALGDNRLDAALFVDRDSELDAALTAVAAGLNTLVLGARGAGKTSFLRQLAYRLRQGADPREVQVLDAGPLDGPHAPLELLADRLTGAGTAGTPGAAASAGPPGPGRSLAAVDRVRAATADRPTPVVVCLDNLAPAAAHPLFGRLRDELWSLPLVWVVAADSEHAAAYLQPPADAFFEQRVELAELSGAAAVELLRRRAGDVDDEHLQALAAAPATPRALVQSLQALAAGRPAGAPVDLAAHAAARLGRPAGMLVAELASRDSGVSASDRALLDRLGWTRARAAQVLRQLEDEGLVRASTVPSPGPGRPRKVYELVRP